MGGTDDPENILLLTPEEHAEAHRKLYEYYGKIEDYLAWKGLSGIVGKEEIIATLLSENGKRNAINSMKNKTGIFDPEKQKTEKFKEGIKKGGQIVGKKMAESGHCKKIAKLGGGKNIGKNFWFNEETKKETQSHFCPGPGWILGRDPEKINLELLRKNCSNVKGKFWIHNNLTGESRMIHEDQQIPPGFLPGRSFETNNVMDLINSSCKIKINGIPQVQTTSRFISFNLESLRWELILREGKKRIIKISHTDYYGLVWAKDCFISLLSLDKEKSEFNFSFESGEKVLSVLKNWRSYMLTEKILLNKKLKKYRKEAYVEKLEKLKNDYIFLEKIRGQIIQDH